MEIKFYAIIKQISTKNLVSGDKETRIVLSVVGADTIEATKLADLEPDKLVKVEYKD